MNIDKYRFRAWLQDEKRIVDVIQFKIEDDGMILIEYKDRYIKQAHIPPKRLMQCLGVKDEDGKLVYDKDYFSNAGEVLYKLNMDDLTDVKMEYWEGGDNWDSDCEMDDFMDRNGNLQYYKSGNTFETKLIEGNDNER